MKTCSFSFGAWRGLRRLVLFIPWAVVLAGRAGAMGMTPVEQDNPPIAPIPPAPPKITIDGQLDDWRSITGFDYHPLLRVEKSGGDPLLDALLPDPPSVTWKTCYDGDHLYVAAQWHDLKAGANLTPANDPAHWMEGGEGIELHLRTDQVIHIACWPAPGGMAVAVRHGDNGPWQQVPDIKAAGAPGADGKSYGQEVSIPWSVITAAGKLPADGQVELGIDFSWNALPAPMINHVRWGTMATDNIARGVTMSFLTARPSLVNAGYIASPTDWGTLGIGATPAGDATVKLPDGSTALASLPVPKAANPPALDGSLDGWDPAQFQTGTYLGALWGNRFSCSFAAQYDDNNLYILANFAQPGPSNLKHETTQAGFSSGDALQIRLSDGTKKVNLCGWYDSQDRTPALTCDQNDLPSPFLLKQGAQESFKPNGKGGYVQVLALPWAVLFGSIPAANSTIKATFEPWFADTTPAFSIHYKTTLEKRPVLNVAYKMPADGSLTLGLFDQSGQLLRWLAQDDYRYAGDNQEAWDGLDQWGKPVAPGSFVLKGIYHAPLSMDYKVSVDNPGNPPWSTPDDKGDWLGDESNPQAAATDGKWVFLACPDAEKGISIMAVDENGQRQWGTGISFNPRCVSLAVDGDYLYALYSGPETTNTSRIFLGKDTAIERAVLVCLDKKTGKAAKFTQKNPMLKIATWPYREQVSWLWDLRNNKSFSPATYAGQPRYADIDVGETTNAIGLATAGGKAYVSLFYDNKIISVSAEDGAATGTEIPVDAPAGLYAPDANTLLAVSGTQIVKINLADNSKTSLITSGLVAPIAVTGDKQGNIYVSDWGSSFQVKVFDSAGKFLRAIGEPGGRPWIGKWDPNGMLVPHGIAVTDGGKLWVAEDDSSPKRVSVWDAQSGSLIRDYIGPTPYGGGSYVWADPQDPTEVYASCVRFKVDYDKKTCVPEATVFRRANHDDPFAPNGGSSGNTFPMSHGGHDYVGVTFGGGLVIMERDGDIYKAVAAVGSVRRPISPKLTLDGTEHDCWDSDLGHHEYPGWYPDCFKGHSGENFTWVDTNGDHLIQPEEMHWAKTTGGLSTEGLPGKMETGWGACIDSNWSFYSAAGFRDKTVIYRLDPKGWTDSDAPIYDPADAKAIVSEPPNAGIQNVYVTHDHKLIATFGYELPKSEDSFAGYDLDGHKLWAIAQPKRWEGKQVHANGVVYDFQIPKLGDVFGTWLWHGSTQPYLITSDGLYVGTLLDHTLLGPAALWGESYTYYYQGPDGTPYVINGGSQAEHILQVKGLEPDHAGRFEGNYTLTDDDAKKAADMRQVPVQAETPKPVLAVTWVGAAGNAGGFPALNLDAGVTLNGGDGRAAQVVLGRDANNLYLSYKVSEKNPMRNGGSDWQMLFTTGDCVDLMLQSDSNANPNRRDAAAGDERLLFSMFQDKPVAVLYRPVVPGASSPVRLANAAFDQLTKLDSAQVAIQRDANGGFYTVQATVPLKDLGLESKPAGDLRGDVGVIFADDSGKGRALRLYYYNHHTELVNDLSTEATLQPQEWGKIVMPLGPNLLQNGDFEEPFVDSPADMDKGWAVTEAKNGSDAAIVTDSPYSGHHSLLLETPVPMVIDPASYKDPDYAAFVRGINGGKGGGSVTIQQQVPVVAGHQYSVRLHYRTLDFQGERKQAGHPRGYISFGSFIEWACPPPNHGARSFFGGQYENTPDWQTVYNFKGISVPTPYTAPDGATSATFVINMRTNAEGHSPKAYLDDVELVDVTPGLMN